MFHFLIFFYIFSSLVTHYPFAIVTWWCEFPKNEYYLAYFHLEMAFKLLNTLILLPLRLWFLTCIYREGDSYDMRKKLPFCVGLLLRLLRKNLRVFVTCTSGFDRSPACVIAYLHWMTDVSLHAAYTWVTGMHTCRPDRFILPNFKDFCIECLLFNWFC